MKVTQSLLMARHPVLVLISLLMAGVVLHANVRPNGPARNTSIRGHAWTAENTPIPNAQLRLRNVTTGKIEALAVADEAGQFTFSNVEGGSYVVEMINDAGRVLTVGHVFTIAPGETVGTFVRLGTRVPWFSGFFANTAAAVASIAASEGITALAPVVRPASSGK